MVQIENSASAEQMGVLVRLIQIPSTTNIHQYIGRLDPEENADTWHYPTSTLLQPIPFEQHVSF